MKNKLYDCLKPKKEDAVQGILFVEIKYKIMFNLSTLIWTK
jgi:hypothetical protein